MKIHHRMADFHGIFEHKLKLSFYVPTDRQIYPVLVVRLGGFLPRS